MKLSKMKDDIPKIIWVLWLQGFENAPEIVKKCVHTWEKANSGWKVIKINRESINKHIDVEKVIKNNGSNMEKSDISDVVRIKILAKYGGVWVDSTCICQRPLDTWLHEYTDSGFFAFSRPTKDREIASWFLASKKGNYLIKSWSKRYVRYFTDNNFSNQNTEIGNFIKMKLEGLLNTNKKTAKVWFSSGIKNLLKIYPYFAFHYKFFENIENDQRAYSVWSQTPKYSADGPLKPIRHGLLDKPPPEMKEEVSNQEVPMYKLSWDIGVREIGKKSLVKYILMENPYLDNE